MGRSWGAIGVAFLLAASCSACASGPRPVPGLRAEASEEEGLNDEDPEPDCGGTIDEPAHDPREALLDWAAALQTGVEIDCGEAALLAGRYGELFVRVRRGDGVQRVQVEPDPTLADDDVACASRVASLEGTRGIDPEDPALPPTGLSAYVSLGNPPPLLPAIRKLGPRWRAAMESQAVRRRFVATLPRHVQMNDAGCLVVPSRRRFRLGLESWLKQMEPLSVEGAGSSAYWLADGQMIVRRRVEEPPWRRVTAPDQVCLVRF
jgi:hypothetical protein